MTPQERPAVVTGASSGIGEATARGLAAAGHAVVLGARRLDRCEQIAEEIAAAGGRAYAFPLDVADEASRNAFVKQAQDAVGDVEVLVSNAGVSRPSSVMDADEQLMLEHLQVNLLGVHALTRAFGQGMVERGRGDLVYVTSETVTKPRPFAAPYVTSKWAVEGMVAGLLMELEGTGVRVSCMGEVYAWGEVPDVPGDFFSITAEHLFGDVWTREGLTIRERRLMLFGAIAALGETSVLPIQLDAALAREEFTPDQLREIAVFLAHYVGWPRAAAFNNLVEDRIRSHKGAGSRQDFPGPKR